MRTDTQTSLISGVLTTRSNPGRAARQMEPIHRNLGADAYRSRPARVVIGLHDNVQDRTVNCVVDRLLKELTW